MGDQHLNTTTGEVFQWNGSSWVSTGNIKGADGNNGTSGSSGTSGADGVSYTQISINSVPQSLDIATFLSNGNAWKDAFVVIPEAYHQWWIIGFMASYGDAWPASANNFIVQQRTWNGGGGSGNVSYSHGPSRAAGGTFDTPLQIEQGMTLHVSTSTGSAPTGGTTKGYTITLYIGPTQPGGQ